MTGPLTLGRLEVPVLVVDVCKTGENQRPLCVNKIPLFCQPPKIKSDTPPLFIHFWPLPKGKAHR